MASEEAQSLRAKVITVSDGVAAGKREDTSASALVDRLEGAGFEIVEHRTIADGVESVSNALSAMAYRFHGLILTTGGTGFGPRDKTPEGTLRVLDRRAPGLVNAMLSANPLGRLSRATAGTRGRALIVNVAGSPAGALEMLDSVLDVLPHALALMGGQTEHPPAHNSGSHQH